MFSTTTKGNIVDFKLAPIVRSAQEQREFEEDARLEALYDLWLDYQLDR